MWEMRAIWPENPVSFRPQEGVWGLFRGMLEVAIARISGGFGRREMRAMTLRGQIWG